MTPRLRVIARSEAAFVERVRLRAGVYRRLREPASVQRDAQYHDSAMLALYPSAELAAALALPDGEQPEELHLTLFFLGKADQIGSEASEALTAALTQLAEQTAPLVGQVSGLGRFSAPADEPDPIYASVDAPGLVDLRAALALALQAAAITPATNHGFTPHITLQYVDQSEATPPDRLLVQPAVFSALSLVIAEERTDFAFTGPVEVARAEADPIDTWLSTLVDVVPDPGAVDAVIARYHRGELSLADAQEAIRQIVQDEAENALSSVDSGSRGDALVLWLGAAGGALAAISLLRGSHPTQDQQETADLAHAAARAEYADATSDSYTSSISAATNAGLQALRDRTQAVSAQLAAGAITAAQAAAQIATITHNAAWSIYQTERATQARSDGATHVRWVLDPNAEHCDDCLRLADGSPYQLDELETQPGDGDTECGPGCKCDLEYETRAEEGSTDGESSTDDTDLTGVDAQGDDGE